MMGKQKQSANFKQESISALKTLTFTVYGTWQLMFVEGYEYFEMQVMLKESIIRMNMK